MSTTSETIDAANAADDPQLSANQRAGAVAIVLGAMMLCLFVIIAFWPADPGSDKNAVYYCQAFHVRPAPTANYHPANTDALELNKKITSLQAEITKLGTPADTAGQHKLATDKKALAEAQDKLKAAPKTDPYPEQKVAECHCTIQLGNLILILVAACGFLGNLIHVSRSLTFYIGMKQFQRSWIPWYFIKPFTASGLALLIYFATNSSSKTGDPINLFTIMLAAGLAGLFTDIATQKLKVIFEAILKPADTRPPVTPVDQKPSVKKTTVNMDKMTPEHIDLKVVNPVSIPGENLDPKTTVITVDGVTVEKAEITATLIKFDYEPKNVPSDKTEFLLNVTDKTNNLNAEKKWKTA